MELTNDHERIIARAVDEKILEDPSDSHHAVVRDVAVSLDFVMSLRIVNFWFSTFRGDSIIRVTMTSADASHPSVP